VTTPQRRALLRAALTFAEVRWRGYRPDAAGALDKYLHSWTGMGDVITGMHAQGFDVEIKQRGAAWRATFYPSGLAHSIVHGAAESAAPWIAVRRAAWSAINEPHGNGA